MNSHHVGQGPDGARNALFRALADGKRRRILGLLYERGDSSIEKRRVATRFAAFDGRTTQADLTVAERERALVELEHVQLPVLEEGGLIERDVASETVRASDHPLFDEPWFVDLVTGPENADDASVDALFDALADARRRTVLSVLDRRPHTRTPESLARDVASREFDADERFVSQDAIERVLVSLIHIHLPMLRDADFVEYDAESNLVTYQGRSDLLSRWLEPSSSDETDLDPDRDASTRDGHESVVSY